MGKLEKLHVEGKGKVLGELTEGKANAFALDEAQQMCKVFRTENRRRTEENMVRGKQQKQQQGIFIVCGWKIDVRVVLRCTVLCCAVIDASHKQHGVCVM